MTSWIGRIPDKILSDIDRIAPMLKKLGYDTKSKIPQYGKPDKFVLDNIKNIQKNSQHYFDKAMNVSDIFKFLYGD